MVPAFCAAIGTAGKVLACGTTACPCVRNCTPDFVCTTVLVGTAVIPVVDGAFATSAPLTLEGANAISIACADASGHALGSAASLTLFRYTNAPSIAITSPATDSELTADKTQVAITVGPGVASGDVNGIAFTVAGDPSVAHSLTIDNVPIANGLNIITARARSAWMYAAATSKSNTGETSTAKHQRASRFTMQSAFGLSSNSLMRFRVV